MAPPHEDAVLNQLGEIQRSIGMLVSTVEGVKEDVRTQATDSQEYRETVTSGLNNALSRIAALESNFRGIQLEIAKTLRPLVKREQNNVQRIIGFSAAMSLMGMVGGFVIWLLMGGFDTIIKAISAFRGIP